MFTAPGSVHGGIGLLQIGAFSSLTPSDQKQGSERSSWVILTLHHIFIVLKNSVFKLLRVKSRCRSLYDSLMNSGGCDIKTPELN